MKRIIGWSLLALATVIFAACNGISGGSKPDAPTNVKIVPGDSSVTVSWDMQSGIEYWIFSAAAPSISTDNWTTLPQAKVVRGAESPQIVAGLVNGTTYSFTVNGRQNSGPGGAGSPSISAVPRLAGQFWAQGTPLNTSSLNGLFYLGITVPGVYTTVGNGGTIFNSPDAISWTSVNSGVTTDLNGVSFGFSRYIVVGKGGAMLASADLGATWTSIASGTTSDLRSVAIGGSGFVAVGAGGTIVRSSDGGNWSVVTSGTTNDLYSVRYGVNNTYYAAGAKGTLLSSTDGQTWTAVNVGTTVDLYDFAYSGITFVTVGAGGAIFWSADTTTWNTVTPITTATLKSITPGSQFVAVGTGGTILTSVDGANWVAANSGTTADLNAVLFGLNGYSIVGAGGVNLNSF
jgi:hypothetical protein